jgi:hypothetical protein
VRTSFVHRARRTNATRFRGAVIDLLEIAQPAVADWRQQLPGRADVGVPLLVVSELVFAEETLVRFSQASMSSILKQRRSATTSIVSTPRMSRAGSTADSDEAGQALNEPAPSEQQEGSLR